MNVHGNLTAKRASLHVACRNYWAAFESKASYLQANLYNETKRAEEEGTKRKTRFVFENGLKVKLHEKGDDSKEQEDF